MLSSLSKKIGFSFTLLLSSLTAHGAIHEAKTMEEVISLFQEIKTTDLALFDVDGVLTMPSDPIFQYDNFKHYKLSVMRYVFPLTPIEKDCFGTLCVTSSPSVLVDEKVLSLFEMLCLRGIKALALSAILSGSIDEIPNLTQWRYEELKRLGIDFSLFFPCPSEIIFDQFPQYRGNFASFYEGVIVCNGSYNPTKKGDVLVAFLSRMNRTIEKVYFVEDTLENLTSTEAILKKKMPRIQMIGIHYTAAHRSQKPTVDEVTFEKKVRELAEKAKSMANKKAA